MSTPNKIHDQSEAMATALAVRADSLKFVSELLAASTFLWRHQLMRHLGNPETTEAPGVWPRHGKDLKLMVDLMDRLMVEPGKEAGSGAAQAAVVSINVGERSKELTINQTRQEQVKAALIADTRAS